VGTGFGTFGSDGGGAVNFLETNTFGLVVTSGALREGRLGTKEDSPCVLPVACASISG
jgi:hypothetical protein